MAPCCLAVHLHYSSTYFMYIYSCYIYFIELFYILCCLGQANFPVGINKIILKVECFLFVEVILFVGPEWDSYKMGMPPINGLTFTATPLPYQETAPRPSLDLFRPWIFSFCLFSSSCWFSISVISFVSYKLFVLVLVRHPPPPDQNTRFVSK